jgi:4-alpha-glucanotransferase
MFALPEPLRRRALAYVGREGEDFNTEAVYGSIFRSLLSSVAKTVIFPMQDLVLFGEDTRLNTPGRAEGNWAFRFTRAQCENAPWEKMRAMLHLYNR